MNERRNASMYMTQPDYFIINGVKYNNGDIIEIHVDGWSQNWYKGVITKVEVENSIFHFFIQADWAAIDYIANFTTQKLVLKRRNIEPDTDFVIRQCEE